MNKIKMLPYGISDFVEIRTSNLYYVDKTEYLATLENMCPRNVFFIRPRRFGKSSFITMMKAYYDKKMVDRFDELFDGLFIQKEPTENRHRYQVLHFDFSRIGGDISVLETNFNAYCNTIIDDFIRKYQDDYEQYVIDNVLAADNTRGKLNTIQSYTSEHRIPLYLIIDEYDNFTNTVLNEEGHAVYHSITHASGFYRDVYKLFKGMFERIFLTGVSPVTLDDLTSGFNIGMNVSQYPMLNNALGFSTKDVSEMLEYYKEVGMLPQSLDIEETIAGMKPWYDNYCFSKQKLKVGERVFNTDMVLYFINQYISYQDVPEDMIDPNTRTDYKKLKKLLNLDQLDGNRKGVIRKIAEEGEILGVVEKSFPAERLTDPNIFVSLIYYYGMLTIKGEKGQRLLLGIPNNNVRKQYYEYLLEQYNERATIDSATLDNAFDSMAFDGDWHEALQYIADAYKENTSVRSAIEGERNIQGFFTALLSLNNYYLLAPELEFSHGYCDFFLLPDHRVYKAEHSYIIELKYLSKGESEARVEAQWTEAVEQIERYAADEKLQSMLNGTVLHKIVAQFSGWDMIRIEETPSVPLKGG